MANAAWRRVKPGPYVFKHGPRVRLFEIAAMDRYDFYRELKRL